MGLPKAVLLGKICKNFFIFVLTLIAQPLQAEAPSINHAMEKYAASSRVQEPAERQKLLNEALNLYLPYAERSPSALLLNNIGSVYFSLGEFGRAIALYRQAEALQPRDARIQANLAQAIEQAGVAHVQITRPIDHVLGVLRYLSRTERYAFALGGILLTFALFSLDLWLPGNGFRWPFRLASCATACLLLLLLAHYLLVPQRAVVLAATPVLSSCVFDQEPLAVARPGEMVEVFLTSPEPTWVKVRTCSYVVGYAQSRDLFFIE